MSVRNLRVIRFTLVTDGTSDAVLLPLLTWIVKQCLPAGSTFQMEHARTHSRPGNLSNKIKLALQDYPCDVLFIHRDAEREPAQKRIGEISDAWSTVGESTDQPVVAVPVIPVRMQEAWFLFDENALRTAAGNPNGKVLLDLPSLRDVESLPDPKHVLYSLLKQASGLQGRRLKKFHEPQAAHRLAEVIIDFSPNKSLSAFHDLCDRVDNAIKHLRPTMPQ